MCWVCGSLFGLVLIYQFQNMSNPVQNHHTARPPAIKPVAPCLFQYLTLSIAIQKQAILQKSMYLHFPKLHSKGSVGFGKATPSICLLVTCSKHACYAAVRKCFLWFKHKWVFANRFYLPLEISSEADHAKNIPAPAKQVWDCRHLAM